MSGPIRVERREDMSPSGRLRLTLQVDGDVMVTVVPDPDAPDWERDSVEFCSCGMGGGKSPRTLQALRDLAVAMEQDNVENPVGRFPHYTPNPRLYVEVSRDEKTNVERARTLDCEADICRANDEEPCRVGFCPEWCVFDGEHRF